MTELIRLDLFDLALALVMVGVAIALSRWQRLDLAVPLAIAAGRTILQLLVAGYILAAVFALDQPLAVLAVLGVMLAIATAATRNRISKRLPGLPWTVAGALFTSTTLTVGYVIAVIVQPPTWYSPQYLIPLAGIVLGNAMNAATLTGERLASTITHSQREIETHLSLGATPVQAIASYRREAIRAGLLPLINRMTIVGLVSLPGMLTGQVLSGVDPLDAALYQILIMFMVAFAELVSVLLTARGVGRQFFNDRWQLCR
ncbi:MAG: iron export ABC transporter permease subunit FetB [Spirulinaceae cyanobacterium SM2_1_0]|nr:iron export ABC transporter permease subunit FetB [Spirulinaceae cyanobacterium SM2_1_0]